MKTQKKKNVITMIWFLLIISLSIVGFQSGCKLNTGGNIFAGLLMLAGPFIFGLGLIILIILLVTGLKNKNQALILISKIGLLFISFPLAYTAGVILCHL